MWKLIKAEIEYNFKSLTVLFIVVVLYVSASIYFYLPITKGFLGGFSSVILFIPQIMKQQEKRDRLFTVLPVTQKQIAQHRILIVLFEIIAFLLLLTIVELTAVSTKNINLEKLFMVVDIMLVLIAGFLLLRDVWFSFFRKKDSIISIIKNSIIHISPIIIIIWFSLNYFLKYDILWGYPKYYFLLIVLLLIGLHILLRTNNSFKNRKSYLD